MQTVQKFLLLFPDGGEWLEGAGEFNALSAMSEDFWEALKSMRSKR